MGREGVGREVEEEGIVDGEESGPVPRRECTFLLPYFRRIGKAYDLLEGH